MKSKSLFILWLALIVFFSVIPHNIGDYSFLRKISFTESGFFQHLFGYFILSALSYRVSNERQIWFWLAGIFLLSIALEIIQCTIPTRSFNLYDLLANAIGVFIVMIITFFKQKTKGALV